MTDMRKTTSGDQEPLGIVISRGAEDDPAPRFRAYVYADAPEPVQSSREVKAA